MIARYALCHTAKVADWPIPKVYDHCLEMAQNAKQPAITRTCRLLRLELLPIFYAQHFSVVFRFGQGTTMRYWSSGSMLQLRIGLLHVIGAEHRR